MTLIHRTLPATAGAGGLNKYRNSNSNDKKKKKKDYKNPGNTSEVYYETSVITWGIKMRQNA